MVRSGVSVWVHSREIVGLLTHDCACLLIVHA
jgi:hypothetical protein